MTKDDVFLCEGGGVVSSGEVYPASRVRRVLWARVALVLTQDAILLGPSMNKVTENSFYLPSFTL
jgi:hypothetical protein